MAIMSRLSRDGDRVFIQVRVTPPVSYVNDTKIAHGTQPAFVEEFDVYPRPAAPGSEAGALSLPPRTELACWLRFSLSQLLRTVIPFVFSVRTAGVWPSTPALDPTSLPCHPR